MLFFYKIFYAYCIINLLIYIYRKSNKSEPENKYQIGFENKINSTHLFLHK